MLQELQAPIHPQQKAKVIEAIRDLGLKVSPADVAEAANIPVLVAAQELNNIATDTAAHLEVSEQGSITYSFDPRFEQSYSLTGTRHCFRKVGRVLLNAGTIAAKALFIAAFFLMRISFGVLLIASVVAIIVVLAVVVLRLLAGGGDSSVDGGGGGDGGFSADGLDLSGLFDASSIYTDRPFWLYLTFDWLWDWIYFGHYLWGDPYYYSYSPLATTTTAPDYSGAWGTYSGAEKSNDKNIKKKSKFLDYCFILFFGQGDPNARLLEKRWHDIAQIIRGHQGVVVAEQVAPYLDVNPNNEDWMLPVLQRFNGIPDVSEAGNIIYTFPQFQEAIQASNQELQIDSNTPTADANTDADALRALYSGHLNRQKIIAQTETAKQSTEPYLQEQSFQLGVPTESLIPILGFAAFAFCGSLYLLCTPPLAFVHKLAPLFTTIAVYSSLFFIVPAVRGCINQYINAGIDERNEKRLESATRLNAPQPELHMKLEEAHNVAIHALNQQGAKIVYTTTKDDLEQQFPS
jgi:hypothetical protein